MISMILLLASTTPAFAADELFPAVGEVARSEAAGAAGFVKFIASGEDDPTSLQYTVLSHRGTAHRLDVVVYKVRTQELADRLWIDLLPSLALTEPELAFSGHPLGTNVRRIQARGSAVLQSIDGVFAVITLMHSSDGIRPTTFEADKVMIEGIARRTLARCRGLQAQAAQNMNVAGTSVGSITGPRGGRLVDLDRYCQARGLHLTKNERQGTANFVYQNEMVIIPLAARKIKDGSRWIESSDISLIRNGKWYVSYAALEEAR